MADFTVETQPKYPKFQKRIELVAGQKLSDDADLLAFAQKTVPTGKKATVAVNIIVVKIEDE